MSNLPKSIAPVRTGLTPQGRDEPRGRCCARCKTPGFGCANDQCKCHPALATYQNGADQP